jgi:uncharacterized coiled-coil protein SlyX
MDATKEAIDRAIERLQNLPDYAGRPSWDKVVAEELNNIIAQKDAEIEQLRNKVRWLEMCENTVVKQNAEIERLRNRLENPTEKMLKAGRAANRLVAGNALGLACIAPDAAWRVMADMILSRSE